MYCCFLNNGDKQMEAKTKGVPKRNGTGQGTRANKGRGGCKNPRTKSKR